STRRGSTISSLWPVIDATFCVATTTPVTRARNIVSRLLHAGRYLGQNLVISRKASLVPLAEDEFAINHDVEDTAVAALRFGLHTVAVGLLDRCRQTGGKLAIASGGAVGDVDLHWQNPQWY